jgi:hypothetical protein
MNGIASGSCPASLGDEPVMFINNENIAFSFSQHNRQEQPAIIAKRSLKGYGGNNRLNHDDIDTLSIVLEGRQTGVKLGMKSEQELHCLLDSVYTNGSLCIQLYNYTVCTNATATVNDFNTRLNNEFDGFYTATLSVGVGGKICDATNISVTSIVIDTPLGVTHPKGTRWHGVHLSSCF